MTIASGVRPEREARGGFGARAAKGVAGATLVALIFGGEGCSCAVSTGPRPSGGSEPGGTPVGGAPTGGTPAGDPGGGSGERLPARCVGKACKPDPTFSTSTSYLIGCPSGSSTCGGDRNGKGVYIARGVDDCFPGHSKKLTFCPEAFVNGPGGGVSLRLWGPLSQGPRAEIPLTAALEVGGAETPVTLVRVEAERTGLVITYQRPGESDRKLSGDALKTLRLRFPVSGPGFEVFTYTLKFEPTRLPDRRRGDWLQRYSLSYQWATVNKSGPWLRHCGAGAENASSLLGGYRVDPVTGEVRSDPAATTLSCVTGAVDSCLAWGYAPWAEGARDGASSEQLFATCVQAKRAAYFAGQGDFSSYTVSGTEIYKRDPFGINAEPTDRPEPDWVGDLEAIWGPRGALCLNPASRRRPDVPLPDNPSLRLPPCDGARWSDAGKLATITMRTPGR